MPSVEGRCDGRRVLGSLLTPEEARFAHGAGVALYTGRVLLAIFAITCPLLLASSPEQEQDTYNNGRKSSKTTHYSSDNSTSVRLCLSGKF
jgi:hypothetical protein